MARVIPVIMAAVDITLSKCFDQECDAMRKEAVGVELARKRDTDCGFLLAT